jgi:hypothetical protein
MIRLPTPDGYLLARHQDHARLAGHFASLWGNKRFPPPAPAGSAALADILVAVARHDDAWAPRDAAPLLTREGRPSAFTRELVGAYSAFEEIDLPDYLHVRGQATETVARDNPLATLLISMHTANLLSEQADVATLKPADRPRLAAFVAGQRHRQRQLAAALVHAGRADEVAPEGFQRAFEFLQACDNLSLLVCVGYDRPRPLRHTHPDHQGRRHSLTLTPLGAGAFRLDPWPFARPEITFRVPVRPVPAAACADNATFRAAYAAAPEHFLPGRLLPPPADASSPSP